MENLLKRVQELEARTRRVEGQLTRWRILAIFIALGAAVLGYTLPSVAQPTTGTNGNAVTAPFVVKGANGSVLFEVKEFSDQTNGNSQDSLMTLYRNGQPAAMYRTTGKMYKDAYDPKENFLNVVETWLYRYPTSAAGVKTDPVPYLASSTALTRGGGSIVVFNAENKASMTPPIAARITATRGNGGAVRLYDSEGRQAKEISPK
jgi:hypothetical protein